MNRFLQGMVAEKCRQAASLLAEIRSSWEVDDAAARQTMSECVEVLLDVEHALRRDESEVAG